MRGGVPREAQVLLALAHDLVDDCRGNAIPAEPANGQVFAIRDQPAHRLADGGHLVRAGPGFPREPLPGPVCGGIRKEKAVTAGEGRHGRCAVLVRRGPWTRARKDLTGATDTRLPGCWGRGS